MPLSPRARRSVAAIAVAALIAIGCAKPTEPEPDKPGSRLVGTWEADPFLDPQLAKYADRAKAASEAPEQSEERELPLHMTFSRGGEYAMEGSVFGHPINTTCQWRVLSEGPEDITVELVVTDKHAPRHK